MRDTAIIMSSRMLSLSQHEIRAWLLNVNKYYFTYNTCVFIFFAVISLRPLLLFLLRKTSQQERKQARCWIRTLKYDLQSERLQSPRIYKERSAPVSTKSQLWQLKLQLLHNVGFRTMQEEFR